MSETTEPIGLSWTVRTSFLRYIAGMPDGRGVLARGAVETAGLGITFPPAGAHFDETSGDGAIRFGGEVTFSGHFGMLNMRIADPWIDTADGSGTLYVALFGDVYPEGEPLDPFVAVLDRKLVDGDAATA